MKTISAFVFDVRWNDWLPANFPDDRRNKSGPTRLVAFTDVDPSIAYKKAKEVLERLPAMRNTRMRTQCKCKPSYSACVKFGDWYISLPENQPQKIRILAEYKFSRISPVKV